MSIALEMKVRALEAQVAALEVKVSWLNEAMKRKKDEHEAAEDRPNARAQQKR